MKKSQKPLKRNTQYVELILDKSLKTYTAFNLMQHCVEIKYQILWIRTRDRQLKKPRTPSYFSKKQA